MSEGELMLVTGGAGFIGSHLCELLLARGYRVRVLDNLTSGRREWVPAGAEFLAGDIQEPGDCAAACAGVAGVFHAAAMSRSGPSTEACDLCTRQNVVGTQNMLLAARAAGARKFIYSGSSTYYGSQPTPQRESTPGDLLNFYALSKWVGEEYCRMFHRLFGFPTMVLRYFSVYGPRQPGEGAYALVLGIFLERWARGEALEIQGSGRQRRDFVHVRDVAEANLAAWESPISHGTYNVGSGENVSIQELADAISARQSRGPARAADAEATLADLAHTRGELGWEPRIPFAEGLRELMDGKRRGGTQGAEGKP